MAVAFTTLDSISSTLNQATYASNAFVPAAGDLLFVMVTASTTIAAGAMTDSQALGMSLVARVEWNAATKTSYLFRSNALAAASSMTVTFDCTGDDAGGTTIITFGVTGFDGGASNAIRQVDARSGNAATTPGCVMGVPIMSTNAMIGFAANSANPAALTPPASWNETHDTGFATPNTGTEAANIVSGQTGSTVSWGSSSATAWGAIVAEIHTSPAERPFFFNRLVLGR